MGHIALYRQFRPLTFDEVVEQKHAVSALRQAVISGKVGHAYLFCGTRGTGKTSIAKIFSRAINCLSPVNGNPCNSCEICRGILDNTLLDVIEMDAASNNSVDNIRRICDEVMYLPSRARYKVYIIDEVHMLSGGAFNALLKTLEEPPAHAVFILATTEPHRIPATIISRCQRYDFRRIPVESIVERLAAIAAAKGSSIEPDALAAIASLSDGALRDGISLLDQVTTGAAGTVTRDDVLRITGIVDDDFLFHMAGALVTGDAANIIRLTEQLVMDGRDIVRFTLDLSHYFRNVLIVRTVADPGNLVQATSASTDGMRRLAAMTDEKSLFAAVNSLSSLIQELKWSPDMRTTFEITLLSYAAERAARSADRGDLPPHLPTGGRSDTRVTERVKESPPPTSATPPVAPVVLPVPVAPEASSSAPTPASPAKADPNPVSSAATADPLPVSSIPDLSIDRTEPEDDFGLPPIPEEDPATVDMPLEAPPVEVARVLTNVSVLTDDRVLTDARVLTDDRVLTNDRVLTDARVPTLATEPEEIPPVPAVQAEFSASSAFSPPPSEEIRPSAGAGIPGYMAPPPIDDWFLAAMPKESAPSVPSAPSPVPAQKPSEDPPSNLAPASDGTPQSTREPEPEPEPERTPAAPVESDLTHTSRMPLSELWSVLLHRWEDGLFSDTLQLKQATVSAEGGVFTIRLPDGLSAYAKSLTEREDYKRIRKDILTVVPGVGDIVVRTFSEASESSPDTDSAMFSSAKPEWLSQMLAFSETAGLKVEIVEKL